MRMSDWSSDVCSSDLINAVSIVHQQLEQARLEMEKAQRTGDLNTAAQLQYGRIPELQQKLEQQQQSLDGQQTDGKQLLKQEVTEEIGRASCRERVCKYV